MPITIEEIHTSAAARGGDRVGGAMPIVAALVEAILAAAVVGIVEGVRAVGAGATGAGPGSWAVVSAVAATGAIIAAAAVTGLLALVARVPPIAAWARDVAGGGPPRAVAVWRAGIAALAAVLAGIAIFAIASRAHDALRFIDGGPFGLLLACTAAPLAAALAIGALALDRRVVARLVRGGRAAEALAGRRIWIATAIAAAAIACGPPLALHLALPAFEQGGVLGGSLLVAAVVVVRASRTGRRRSARIAAALALVACAAGVWRLAHAERARGLVVVHGVFSRAVARVAWALADRDGDGYPPASAGGADCDDTDPRRHPTAMEIAGNGIDENCTGADATAAAIAERAAPRPSAPAPHHGIVLITVDALRADHLGAYGYRRPTSPSIDAFAATAARFRWALTPCPATRCAIPALATGQLPAARDPAAPTLAQLLRGAGWETAAITCCERFSPGTVDTDGFAHIDTSPDSVRVRRTGQSNADAVADAALRWLAARPRGAPPFLLWLHFYDPHQPYDAPEDADRFGDGALDRYDAEIAFADRHIGRVLAALDPQTTIVALTADHGEEFGEHGTRFHARSLFNQVVRVPLLVRYPARRRASSPSPSASST